MLNVHKSPCSQTQVRGSRPTDRRRNDAGFGEDNVTKLLFRYVYQGCLMNEVLMSGEGWNRAVPDNDTSNENEAYTSPTFTICLLWSRPTKSLFSRRHAGLKSEAGEWSFLESQEAHSVNLLGTE